MEKATWGEKFTAREEPPVWNVSLTQGKNKVVNTGILHKWGVAGFAE